MFATEEPGQPAGLAELFCAADTEQGTRQSAAGRTEASWLTTSKNSPKPSTGGQAMQGGQIGLSLTSTFQQPSARQLFPARIKARKGESPGGTGHAIEDAQDTNLLCKQQGSAQALVQFPLCRMQDRGAGEPSLLSITQPGAETAENTEVGC